MMADALLTLDELAKRLRVSPRTLRRHLPALQDREPGLRRRKLGRLVLFTEGDFLMLLEAMACQPSSCASMARTRTVSVVKANRAALSAQDRVREMVRLAKEAHLAKAPKADRGKPCGTVADG